MAELLRSEMLEVAKVGVSPLKSGVMLEPEGLYIDILGRYGDRDYMFVEGEQHTNVRYSGHMGELALPGHFLSQREDPVLAQIHAVPEDSFEVTLSHGGSSIKVLEPHQEEGNLIDVSVWGWQGLGVDQGNEAAEWGREIFGRAVRLVKTSIWSPRFVEDDPSLGEVGFSDGYPLLVTSTGSMDAVNQQLALEGKPPITTATFRPNLVLETGDHIPFLEDFIRTIRFETDDLIWEAVRCKPCGRCVIVERDPATGELKPGVQKALTSLDHKGTYMDERFGSDEKVFFGQNFNIKVPEGARFRSAGALLKGANVQVELTSATNWRRTR